MSCTSISSLELVLDGDIQEESPCKWYSLSIRDSTLITNGRMSWKWRADKVYIQGVSMKTNKRHISSTLQSSNMVGMIPMAHCTGPWGIKWGVIWSRDLFKSSTLRGRALDWQAHGPGRHLELKKFFNHGSWETVLVRFSAQAISMLCHRQIKHHCTKPGQQWL